jgi:hypothetical protein
MPVVVNDFEVLPAAAPAPQPQGGSAKGGEGGAKDKVEPCEVAAALRCLERQALRVWPH